MQGELGTMEKKATISDVAKLSGVSVATVSRALNHPHLLKETTLQRVYRAVKETGFDNLAPLLRPEDVLPARNKLFLIVVPHLQNLFYSKVITGISDSALRQNSQAIIYQTSSAFHPDALFSLVEALRPSGLVLLDPVLDAERLTQIDTIVPTVQCCEFLPDCNVSYVSIDDFSATKSLIQLMLSKGLRRIALLNGPQRFKYARQRKEGYLSAYKDLGLVPEESLMVTLPDISYAAAFSVMTQLLGCSNPPDSCFAVSDILAAAALKAAKRAGLRVPEDFRIAGFDNTYLSTLCDPAITTVSQPGYQLGFVAGELLMEKIANPEAPPSQILLDTELIIRDSL